VADAVRAILFEDAANAFARRADARQVRRRLVALALDVEHRFERPVAVEPPAPKVTEKNLGFSERHRARAARSFSAPSGGLRGKELEAESTLVLCHEGTSLALAGGQQGRK
jgi:hypothetical protein